MTSLSPMAEEMREELLKTRGVADADIERMTAVLVRCDKLMVEAITQCVREGIRDGFNQIFALGIAAGVAISTIVASVSWLLQ